MLGGGWENFEPARQKAKTRQGKTLGGGRWAGQPGRRLSLIVSFSCSALCCCAFPAHKQTRSARRGWLGSAAPSTASREAHTHTQVHIDKQTQTQNHSHAHPATAHCESRLVLRRFPARLGSTKPHFGSLRAASALLGLACVAFGAASSPGCQR